MLEPSAGRTAGPDFGGGSIVNLMASLAQASGATSPAPPLRLLQGLSLADARTLVLMVVDGLGDGFLREVPPGILAPSRIGAMDSVVPSTTATAITTFLTGAPPAGHGVTGWFMFLEAVQQVVCTLRATTRVGALPLADATRTALYGPGGHAGIAASQRAMHVVQPQGLLRSPYTRAYAQGASLHGYRTLAGFMEITRTLARADGPPRYVYAYWPELDHLGHEHGMDSPACRQHLAVFQTALAGLARALRGTGTAVLVTGDHGFMDVLADRVLDPTTVPGIAACLDGPLAGEPRLAYARVHAGMHDELCAQIASHYGAKLAVQPSRDLLDAGYFGGGQRHPALASRLGDCVLLPADGYMVRDQAPGEPSWRPKGVHGGLSAAELRVPLCVLVD